MAAAGQIDAKHQRDLDELLARLKDAAGPNLKSVVLYGSAVTGEYQDGHSDLNLLCVVERLDPDDLGRLAPVMSWWASRAQRAPMLVTQQELASSADVFAIELLDITRRHRRLFGDDLLTTLEVPLRLHRVQVEQELRQKLIALRQSYMQSAGDSRSVLFLLTASVSSFTTLFRHALLAAGKQEPNGKRATLEEVQSEFGIDMSAPLAVLDLRESKRKLKEADSTSLFRDYAAAISAVIDRVDALLRG